MDYLTYFVLGLSAGAVYAALAQALVITSRGSGVLNLSQGAMAMYIAYTFRYLRMNGELVVPPLPNPLSLIEGVAGWFGANWDLPNIPTWIDLGGPWRFWPALVASLGLAAVMGLLLHVLVFRPLRSAPPLAKIVAAVGIMITLQAIAARRYGPEPVTVPAVLPRGSHKILGIVVPDNRLILVGIVVAITVLLTCIYRFTKFGAATEAAATDEVGAVVTGLAPDRLAALNWMLSSVVGGAIGILFATVTGLSPTSFTFLVLPALGAALIGGLRSFWITTAAGLVIGGLQSITLLLPTRFSWFPRVGAADGLPFLVIVVAMIVRGRRLPQRGSTAADRFPPSPEPRNVGRNLAIGVPLASIAIMTLPADLRNGLITSLVGVILALSMVVLAGLAGQVSLMQMALAGISAMAMTRLAGDWGIPFPIAPLIAIVFITAIGAAVSLPALRVRGVTLAVTTLGAAVAAKSMLFSNPAVLRPEDATNKIPAPNLFGLDLGINAQFPIGRGDQPSPAFGMLALACAVLAIVLVANVRKSATGRQLLGVRSNERSSASVGVDVGKAKLMAFTISAFLAGLAGTVNAYRFQGVSDITYEALASVSLLAFAYLGGITTISGALFAGFLVAGGLSLRITQKLLNISDFEQLFAGIGLVLTAVLNPEGVSGVVRGQIANVRTRLQSRRATTAADERLAAREVVSA